MNHAVSSVTGTGRGGLPVAAGRKASDLCFIGAFGGMGLSGNGSRVGGLEPACRRERSMTLWAQRLQAVPSDGPAVDITEQQPSLGLRGRSHRPRAPFNAPLMLAVRSLAPASARCYGAIGFLAVGRDARPHGRWLCFERSISWCSSPWRSGFAVVDPAQDLGCSHMPAEGPSERSTRWQSA